MAVFGVVSCRPELPRKKAARRRLWGSANGHLQSHKSKDGNMAGSNLLKDLQSAVGTEHHPEMVFCICVFMFDIVLFLEQW